LYGINILIDPISYYAVCDITMSPYIGDSPLVPSQELNVCFVIIGVYLTKKGLHLNMDKWLYQCPINR